MKNLIDSVGTLYAAQDLFDEIQNRAIDETAFLKGFRNYGTSTAKAVLALTTRLSWVAVADSGQLVATEMGRRAHLEKARHLRLRHQLGSIIENFRPAWAAMMTKGRLEAELSLPSVIKQCFTEALIFECPAQEIVDWWDRLAGLMREKTDKERLEIGRKGEKLTLEFEKERTGQYPQWKAVETNFAGYDILSVKNPGSVEKLMIEVKASTRGYAETRLHLTTHEWETAMTEPDAYRFHFWLLESTPSLYEIQTEEMAKHIPVNSGKGTWEETTVPLQAVTPEKTGVVFPGNMGKT